MRSPPSSSPSCPDPQALPFVHPWLYSCFSRFQVLPGVILTSTRQEVRWMTWLKGGGGDREDGGEAGAICGSFWH